MLTGMSLFVRRKLYRMDCTVQNIKVLQTLTGVKAHPNIYILRDYDLLFFV